MRADFTSPGLSLFLELWVLKRPANCCSVPGLEPGPWVDPAALTRD